MVDEQRTSRLGRGLAALIGDAEPGTTSAPDSGIQGSEFQRVPIEFLRANPYQPRKSFNEEDLHDLTNSVREKGILQPILIRRVGPDADQYEIVAGERRWRAAQQAGLAEVPVVIKDLSDNETLEIALIENVQRADLNSIEEAAGYQRLIEQFDYTQEQLAKLISKSRSHVANTLRLLTLPTKVQDMVSGGQLTAGHARALVSAEKPEEVAAKIVAQQLNVRQAEAIIRQAHEAQAPDQARRRPTTPAGDADTHALEVKISEALGLKVAIRHKGESGGELRVQYKTLEQLDDICRRLAQTDGVAPF